MDTLVNPKYHRRLGSTLRGGSGLTGSAADIFVSYKAEDRGRVKPLVTALEAEGFSVWWDAHIGGGTNWHQDIEQHLKSAKCVLVAWTSGSVGHEGHFVRDEARRAQRRGVYLPVCLDAVDPPLGFGEIQALSLQGWKGSRSDRRFRAVADAVRERLTGSQVESARASHDQPKMSRRTVLAGGAGAAAAAVVGVAAWELLKPSAASASASIAVLPFANLSGDPNQAYFSDGIADEIRSALTRLGGLTVIGSTSSEAVRNDDARTAAHKLGVANILTGNVRQSPSTIRISAELIEGRTGADRWTQNYDRAPGDAIKIQTDIAENVASALKGALGLAARAAITLGGTADSVAQDLILQARKLGRESSREEAFRRRIALADAAIARDPNYADAYVEKATVLVPLATNFASTPAMVADQLAQADAAAQRAVALAPKLGSAHTALANVASSRLDFGSVLRETRESLALAPKDPVVLAYGLRNLAELGSADEAVRMADRGIAFDPLNARFYRHKSEALVYLRRYSEAMEAGRKALQLAPELRSVHIFVGDAFLLVGQSGQAKAEYQAVGADNPFSLARLALLAARTGDRAGADRMIAQLRQQVGASASFQFAEIYAQLGDKDRAFAEFGNALRVKDAGLVYLKVDPFLDPIRDDPRYAALLRRLNFP
jgi:serine/threonine-protein kinase